MTAFNEVLTTEEEAAKAIETAKEAAVTATVQARADHRTNLEAEAVKLEQAEESALSANQAKVDEMVKKIQTEVATAVAAVEKKFVAKKVDLKTVIKQSF